MSTFPEAAFDLVTEEIDWPAGIRQAARAAWIGAFERGDTRLEVRALAAEVFEVEWHWPEFERWHAFFVEEGIWPVMWEAFEPPHDLEEDEEFEAGPVARVRLLTHTLSSTTYRLRDTVNTLPTGWSWDLAVVGDGDDVEPRIAALHQARVRRGDLSALPPYFPGDRTSLRRVPPDAASE